MLYKSCSRKLSIYNTDDVKQKTAQGGCGCPIPGGIQGQAGCGFGQPGLVVGDSAHSRGVKTWWSLWSFLTPAILWWFYDDSMKTTRRINLSPEKKEISEVPSFFLSSPSWTHLPIPLGSSNKIKEHLGPIIYKKSTFNSISNFHFVNTQRRVYLRAALLQALCSICIIQSLPLQS